MPTATVTDLSVSTTILKQLGGARFRVMTGAKNFTGTNDSLTFQIPRAKSGITHVRVTLNAMDLYHMEFMKVRGGGCQTVATVDGLYDTALQAVFTEQTGLDTHL